MWKPPGGRAEIAGDLLLATNRENDVFVQFSKVPFPIATARSTGGQWQIEFGANERSWAGRGPPPDRLIWFELPRALAGAKGPRWRFTSSPDGHWRLEGAHGEFLEGAFFP